MSEPPSFLLPYLDDRPVRKRKLIFTATENKAVEDAYVRHGYTMKEIAAHSGIHYATVSRRLKRFDETRDV